MTFDSSKFKAIMVAVLAMFAALYLGISAATAQLETLVWVVGGITVSICLMLGRRIWLLIPFMAALSLTFRIPGLPTSLLVAQGLFLVFTVMLLLMRKAPCRIQFTELEFWILLLFLFVFQVYVRNPVNIGIFGGATVGGRPYFIFIITLVSCLLLAGLRVPSKDLALIFPLTILGGILNFILFAVGFFAPGLGMWYGAASGFANASTTAGGGSEQASRVSFLGQSAKSLSLWICCKIPPLRAILHPVWLGLILLSLIFAAVSGFRNSVAAVGFTYICGLYYRGGYNHLFGSALIGGASLALLALVNLTSPLPPNIQRSLSFLPGSWEEKHRLDASGSTEWRVEIWKEVLLTDRWIHNKLLGDGLGFTSKELAAQMNLKNAGSGLSGFDAHRETILSNGDYHSGPVQTIRTIGYIGLAALLLGMFRLSVHAHRQIQRCRGTEWFQLALLIGIPLIWGPFFFILVFGSFEIGASSFLFGVAMVRMLENNLPLPAYAKPNRLPFALQSGNHRRVREERVLSGQR